MSDIDQLLTQIPLAAIAQELGVDESQAAASSRTALEALLGGLQANASDPAGALSLGQALGTHDGSLLGADLGDIDQEDGSAIVHNIFGGNTSDVIAQLGGVKGSGGSGLIAKLLPILAPFVLAWLGQKLRGQGGMGDILGQVLGGAAGGAGGSSSGAGGGGLGDILGQVLGGAAGGGSSSGAGGGGLGDILGQVLGGSGTSAGSADSADSGLGLPEQPTGPLIPTDGSDMSDVTDGSSNRSTGAQDNPMGGVLGDILGQVLGGGSSSGSGSSSSPNITDILGGLLGGGKR
ncbi:MAG: DUF937 domain-containing protein [Actinomycetales bacterium]|jgi:hypothetical protein|uniref:DUF937 domain-containing protein n=1 Tax=Candidatus Phosphoribacter hodrii TaxID=2953743 RepID=A0A935IL46_9MICO|nr:DUF937 domain-containing protein [Candidatus Phosphoribacter hodrii]MBP8837999.1 DUF937 domain-containing protein [Dermatophilaceae bacterium]MBL0005332.1 DUF937 domain-containing protein [Candidatus Phosphoribacter hodrii]HNV14257.1 DUF937 domain-containing protein [Dermatophilaceae bacterium]HOR15379.1 DUF937 domain-containing protein [Dermatophilaceae bacterium]